MGRPALPQVELDRVGTPLLAASGVIACDDEVDGEAPEHTLASQVLGDPARLAADLPGVTERRWKPAADVALPAGTAEQLVVRGEQLDLAERGHAELHARAVDLGAGDALLDDSAAGVKRG